METRRLEPAHRDSLGPLGYVKAGDGPTPEELAKAPWREQAACRGVDFRARVVDSQARLVRSTQLDSALGRSRHVIALMSTALKIDTSERYENFEVVRQEGLGRVPKLLPGTAVFRIFGRRVATHRDNGLQVHVHM